MAEKKKSTRGRGTRSAAAASAKPRKKAATPRTKPVAAKSKGAPAEKTRRIAVAKSPTSAKPSTERSRRTGITAPSKSATKAAKAGVRGSVAHPRRRSGDKLAVYRSMRDFGRTPEPEGTSPRSWKKTGNPYFVIQKHAASRLHYDFRLEVDGVLKSWAVPKGPSMDPAVKRLAVEVEDHPVEYADFEGIIPENEYGGGTVIVWDAGPYRNIKRKAGKEVPMSACHEKGQIEVWLEGKKIRGGFALVHTRMDESGRNWLLVKMKDEAASDDDPVAERGESVISGRTLEQVRSRPGRVWSSR